MKVRHDQTSDVAYIVCHRLFTTEQLRSAPKSISNELIALAVFSEDRCELENSVLKKRLSQAHFRMKRKV